MCDGGDSNHFILIPYCLNCYYTHIKCTTAHTHIIYNVPLTIHIISTHTILTVCSIACLNLLHHTQCMTRLYYYHSYSVQCMYIVHVHAILLSKLLLYTYQYHMHIIRTADYISQHSNIYLTSSTHCVQERQPTCPQTSGEYVRLTFLTQSWPR